MFTDWEPATLPVFGGPTRITVTTPPVNPIVFPTIRPNDISTQFCPVPQSLPVPPAIPSNQDAPQRWGTDDREARAGRTAGWKLRKVALSPKFESKNLEGWLREVRFWQNLHHHVEDQQMLACLGLNSLDEIKELLMDFFEEENALGAPRRMEDFLDKVKMEYGAVSDVVKAEKLSQLIGFKKKTDWDIRKFWRRFHQLQMRGRQAGVILEESIQFTQLFQALSLSNSQRQMVLAFFETSNSAKTLANLKAITIRLFGTFCQDPLETFANRESRDSSEGSSPEEDEVLHASNAPKKKLDPAWSNLLFGEPLRTTVWKMVVVMVIRKRARCVSKEFDRFYTIYGSTF